MSLGYMFYDDVTANRQQLICELAYVLTDFEGNQVRKPTCVRINPESNFETWNVRTHHITELDVANAPTILQLKSKVS